MVKQAIRISTVQELFALVHLVANSEDFCPRIRRREGAVQAIVYYRGLRSHGALSRDPNFEGKRGVLV